jgi:hypothetical protein
LVLNDHWRNGVIMCSLGFGFWCFAFVCQTHTINPKIMISVNFFLLHILVVYRYPLNKTPGAQLEIRSRTLANPTIRKYARAHIFVQTSTTYRVGENIQQNFAYIRFAVDKSYGVSSCVFCLVREKVSTLGAACSYQHWCHVKPSQQIANIR